MSGYDQQLQFATAMARTFSDATADMMRASSSFWSAGTPPEPGRSWYRPPAVNPFDLSSWFSPFSAMVSPWSGPWGSSFGASMMPPGYQPWTALASFASTMSAFESAQTYWSSFTPAAQKPQSEAWAWQALLWPLAQFDAIGQAGSPAEFANYRSSGGHAAAPITLQAEPTRRSLPSLPKLH
jgi:hypothetical protein